MFRICTYKGWCCGEAVGKLRRTTQTFLSVGSLSFLFVATAYGAQATANFDQEWAKLIAAAKQEGTVAIASGGAPSRQYRPVADVFQKKFGVKVEVSTGSATDTVNRVLAERKAGKYTMDVALISSRESNQRLVPSESLIPFAPLLIHPEVVDKSAWYRGRYWYSDNESKYTFIYHVSKEDQYETWYNTHKIKEAEIATIKKQTDFFDPRWKGKIAGQGMGDPSGLRQMIDSYFEPDRGQEWVRTYLLDAGITFSDDRRILETWLTGARFPLQAVATGSEELITLAKKGIPIKQIFLPKQVGLIRAGGSGCCISAFANAPHPNALRIYVDYLLSPEGQLEWSKAARFASLRRDVPRDHVLDILVPKENMTYRDISMRRYVELREEIVQFIKSVLAR